MVSLLLKHGGDPNYDPLTMWQAVYNGNVRIMKLLMNLDSKTKDSKQFDWVCKPYSILNEKHITLNPKKKTQNKNEQFRTL